MSANHPPIKLLVFDLGGVLVRICHGWAKACEHLNLPRPAAIDDPRGYALLTDVGVRYETGRIDEATFIAEASRLSGLSREQVRIALYGWIIEPYPGIFELLDRLEAAADGNGLRTACLSNTNATHWSLVQSPGKAWVPLERLHFRFASHLIGAMKPDPAIYEHVEKNTGVEPGAILFFDDHPPNVNGARQRGWRVEQIDPAGDSAAQMAAHLRRHGICV